MYTARYYMLPVARSIHATFRSGGNRDHHVLLSQHCHPHLGETDSQLMNDYSSVLTLIA